MIAPGLVVTALGGRCRPARGRGGLRSVPCTPNDRLPEYRERNSIELDGCRARPVPTTGFLAPPRPGSSPTSRSQRGSALANNQGCTRWKTTSRAS